MRRCYSWIFFLVFFLTSLVQGQIRKLSEIPFQSHDPNNEPFSNSGELNGKFWVTIYESDKRAYRLLFVEGERQEIVFGPVSYISTPVRLGNTLYFFSSKPGGTYLDEDILFWKTDGTIAGTVSISLDALDKVEFGSIPDFILFGDQLVFLRFDRVAKESNLFRYHSDSGFQRITTPMMKNSYISAVRQLGGNLFVKVDSNNRNIPPLNNRLLVFNKQMNLIRSRVNLNPLIHKSLFQGEYFDSKVYFSNEDTIHGSELWRMDLDTLNPQLYLDLSPGKVSSWLSFYSDSWRLLVYKNEFPSRLNFAIYKIGIGKDSLQSIDTLKIGNRSFAKMNELSTGSFGIFSDFTNGSEPVLLSSSDDSIIRLKDIWQGISTSVETNIKSVVWNGNVYFMANDGRSGTELWRSDGTSQGTVRCGNIFRGAANEPVKAMEVAGNFLYLIKKDETGKLSIYQYAYEANPLQSIENSLIGMDEWFQSIGNPFGSEIKTGALSIIQDGDILISGIVEGNSVVFFEQNLEVPFPRYHYSKGYLARFSKTGILKAKRIIPYTIDLDHLPIAMSKNGDFFVSGSIGSGDTIGQVVSTFGQSYEGYLASFSPELNLNWARLIRGYPRIRGLAVTPENELLVVGFTYFGNSLDFGSGIKIDRNKVNEFGQYSFMSKYDKNGKALWAYRLFLPPGLENAIPVDFKCDFEGNSYLLLSISDRYGSKDPYSGKFGGALVSFNPNGTMRWSQIIATEGISILNSFALSPFGSISLGGQFEKSISFSNLFTLKHETTRKDVMRPFIAHFSTATGKAFSANIPFNKYSNILQLKFDNDGNLYAFEKFRTTIDYGSEKSYHYYLDSAAAWKFNFKGEVLAVKKFSNVKYSMLENLQMELDPSGFMVVADEITNNSWVNSGFDSVANIQNFLYSPTQFLTRIKIDNSNFTMVEPIPLSQDSPFLIFPNPSNGIYWIQILDPNLKIESINVCDMQGRKFPITVSSSNPGFLLVEFPDMPAGIYTIEIHTAGKWYHHRHVLR